MRAHRQLRQRLARIEGQQFRLSDDPTGLRQAMIRTLRGSLPLDESTELVDTLIAMPRAEARAFLVAEIERRTA